MTKKKRRVRHKSKEGREIRTSVQIYAVFCPIRTSQTFTNNYIVCHIHVYTYMYLRNIYVIHGHDDCDLLVPFA